MFQKKKDFLTTSMGSSLFESTRKLRLPELQAFAIETFLVSPKKHLPYTQLLFVTKVSILHTYRQPQYCYIFNKPDCVT
jgi:hypothetical protein